VKKRSYDIMGNIEEQIKTNIILEKLVNELRFEEIKLNKKIKAYQYKIKSYTDKIKNTEKYKKTEKLKNRMNIFVLTCKNMIKQIEKDIEEMREEITYKREYAIEACQEVLVNAIREGNINEDTLFSQNGHLIYMIPSARLIFKPQEISISNKEILRNFLRKNKLDLYIDGDEIYLNLLRKDVLIAEDGSICNNDGLIFEGLSLTDSEMKLEVF
jgi:hypothetical protein